ncbi:LysR family transcriptional regulator substrate-binding protein [Frigoribacterium sp. 2-23]|uniref:LysR family transcriptional regulator substrate-binding protein n=1 Tax=Frigoribacterium sp. 2-23 TaxID=3415006 RepID=UPI003C6F44E5
MTTEPARASFGIGFVPGVTLAKWSRLWEERRPDLPLAVVEVDARDPLAALADGRAEMVLARLPIEGDGFSVIPLYDERIVVVVSKEHEIAALELSDEIATSEFADEHRHDLELTPADAVDVVATGAGVAVMPQSLARLHARKGVTYRFVSDLPPVTVGLVWPVGRLDDDIDDFIGVVRGRTARSSRGRRRDDEDLAPTPPADEAVDPDLQLPKQAARKPPKAPTKRGGSMTRGEQLRAKNGGKPGGGRAGGKTGGGKPGGGKGKPRKPR